MIVDHAPLSRAVREQRLHLTRHVESSRGTWADGYMLGRVVVVHLLAILGVLWAAGAL